MEPGVPEPTPSATAPVTEVAGGASPVQEETTPTTPPSEEEPAPVEEPEVFVEPEVAKEPEVEPEPVIAMVKATCGVCNTTLDYEEGCDLIKVRC